MDMAQDQRERLRQHFESLPPEKQVDGWDLMWQQKVTPWDQNQPNPALVEALETKPFLTTPAFKDGEAKKVRKKALVPGCGGGYDVQLFASYGFDAYGVDGSRSAIDKAQQHLKDQEKEQKYKLQDVQRGRGISAFIMADFWDDAFLEVTHQGVDGAEERKFDLIYDYTFLCALPPPLRPKWAARLSQLLAPDGILVTTQYPLGKDPRLGGPPFGLSLPLYEQLLEKPGREVNYDLNGHVVEDRSGTKDPGALVAVETYVPGQVFESQKGSIAVSLWKHWKS